MTKYEENRIRMHQYYFKHTIVVKGIKGFAASPSYDRGIYEGNTWHECSCGEILAERGFSSNS
jgi:hypothetical protein